MTTLRFVPQALLDSWLEAGKADIRAGLLHDLSSREEFVVREAARFLRVESGDDFSSLVGKVKSVEQLKALGAEQCMTSVIVGETVYEVAPGWIAEEPSAPASRPAGSEVEGKNPEADMLARLLLDKLS
ncbi:MAG TPA: hypothetical protein DFS52_13595 [Myxococcales bacterium]|jgi:hypothetical protein|nr:hypothetical protein [Myxococcales bacterium]